MIRFSTLGAVSVSTLTAVLLTGCVAYSSGGDYSRSHAPGGYGIPPGHMPPPGECRIWYHDSPPGQQPPPGDCYDMQRRVPPGAALIRG
ncbi:hypothetical protein HOP51_07330 [Halomonas sp. MCCC 1A11036]|uniref:Lipoprotein n=1 Tax=Billgrantia zhangzhouensis TaxID=2733481 RepID=A0ABS9ADY7_9GAMM|nr:hypothetical protein [Halomonas zhangzhouensis]MCE8019925.1 hypothetical protein [Halomonas zhangzhouensis]